MADDAKGRPRESGSVLRTARGALFVIHFFPAVMNGLAGLVFFLIASHGAHVGPSLLVGLSMFLVSAAVGSLNDFLDVDLDRQTGRDKPIVRGDISSLGAFRISVAAAIAGVLLALSFGLPVVLVALLVLASGLAYDVWLKGTLWSWVPYGIGIPALPVWSFLAADAFTPVLLFSFPLGLLVSLALYLANTIPDIGGDTAYGIAGLGQRLGVDRALLVAWICFAVSIGFLALTPMLLGNDIGVLIPGLLVGVILLAAMIVDDVANRSPSSLRRGWYMSAVLGGVLGVSWVASLPAE